MIKQNDKNIDKNVREIHSGKIGVIKGFYGYYGTRARTVVKVLFKGEKHTEACFGTNLEIIE